MKKSIIIILAAVVAVIVFGVVAINSYTVKAINYEEKVTEAYSAIKVQEKRRADLYPTLADAIKSHNEHVYNTFVDTVKARTAKDGTISDESVNEINHSIKMIIEDYPQLESSDNYQEFMKESSITENKIAETREAYNKTVSRYNTYTRNPINKFFLNLYGYEIQEFEKLSYDVSEDAPRNLFD